MTPKKGSTKRPAKGKADPAAMEALAHHISEALRIMRTSEIIPARIYNYFADAWNELCGLAERRQAAYGFAHRRQNSGAGLFGGLPPLCLVGPTTGRY